MHPFIKIIVILAGILLFSPSSYAASDGNSLLEKCAEAEKSMDNRKFNLTSSAFCLGIVAGVKATMLTFATNYACFPEGSITNGQGVRIVLAYLRKNPAQLHKPLSHLVIRAFMDAYPCE